uniref:AlNc14C12G1484 protein n=1 Tax=Albugo laibachii Nc14 TaxID=890382 RepID=F0W3A7_9STRA|nr:AlNc14C12G1484 [Albugo laibachii Nc14]|eukprot:CCA15550.1 AlNc14C12G1484 [Albugo laibachii Nc14]
MQYARLTNMQEKKLRVHHIAHPEMTQHQLAECTLVAFELRVPPSRMTIHRVLKAAKYDSLNTSQKSSRSIVSPQLEQELLCWIRECERWKIPIVTGATIRENADAIRERLIVQAAPSPLNDLSALTFSNGWLSRFQKRNGLSTKITHGKASLVKIANIRKLQNRRVVKRFDALLQCVHDVDSQTMQEEIDLLRQVDVLEAMRWAQDD